MKSTVLLLTPPFTQLNTPYPATAYLKGYLRTLDIASPQCDLGIEVILKLFSAEGLRHVFEQVEKLDVTLQPNEYRIYAQRRRYIKTIDAVIAFLQNKNPTLAHSICDRSFLPEASRFVQLEDLEWAFGTLGIQDKAKHLATLYLEDIGDFIRQTVDKHFGFSRYAERLGRTATHFDELLQALQDPDTVTTEIMNTLLQQLMEQHEPRLVCLSVPFPGNLFGALKCAQFVKKNFPATKVALGGGFANTELRSLSDARVFDFIDFVCLDDGEVTLKTVLEYLDGKRTPEQLKRVFMRINGAVSYCDAPDEHDVAMKDSGTPDYDGLPLKNYLSVLEVANPMHRLWSDGRWNKLTLAHGCYWGKCSFCDVSLDYIKRYEPLTASLICDRMQQMIAQTGETGFHFVDEAAPPNLLRELAIEIIRRGMVVSWWTNIRFERAFTYDLAHLLKASGCIAVAGGLEVASDRLLEMMKKGVTVSKVAQVADAFTSAGIMVHAYLMYGFPTQNMQETIDSLEMVRQLFEEGVLQSGFWHRFAMTAHSPVGLAPDKYMVQRTGPDFGGFADNDLFHEDPSGADHDLFAEGLRTSLFNYMHGTGFDIQLSEWFDFETPETSIAPGFIQQCLHDGLKTNIKMNSAVIWLGLPPELIEEQSTGKKTKQPSALLEFYGQHSDWTLQTDAATAHWLMDLLPRLIISSGQPVTFKEVKESYEQTLQQSFEKFTSGKEWHQLKANGLLVL